MKVICAPDKFKESLSAIEAAQAMKRGILRACPDAAIDLCPIADGGEGFIDTLHAALGGTFHIATITGPRHTPISARWLSLPASANEPPTAAVEMSLASGLQLLAPSLRDPTLTTTFGTGQLILHALQSHHTRILLGIGGSATCDGGIGMATALGARFLDASHLPIHPQPRGCDLPHIQHIDLTAPRALLQAAEIIVACDVTNPLIGPYGAAHVYAPQKGASPAQVLTLDVGLAHLAHIVRSQFHRDFAAHPGAGAAGGLGFGLLAFAQATLKPGIDLILDAVRFHQRVQSCDLCITGEGKLDGQSLAGKACLGIAQAAAKYCVPTIALVGAIGADAQRALQAGISSYHVIGEGLPIAESIRRAAELLEQTAERVIRHQMQCPDRHAGSP